MVQLYFLTSLLAGTVAAQRWTTRWGGGGGGRPTTVAPQPQVPTTTQKQAAPGGTQSLYGQCGGQQWTGATICPVGAYCKSTPTNVWYAQCVAVAGDSPLTPNPDVTIRTLTTVFSVGGPTPTVISTRITYLTPKPSSTSVASVVTVTLTPDEPCEHEFYC
ncbi:hypothetical protein B0H63DRAFT_485632 [Podospora didyma]|uniref:CBM1 domain-containing protein n=1 Tax=Podospora didyma TaxID=330526 RepID=A0AAE0N564_9PEZI|nr:hypothetical protein B0H63DRAFT_485632 [Podospora didyma]